MLTDTQISKFEYFGKATTVPEGTIPGLSLRIGARKKTWVLRYTNKQDARTLKTLGAWPALPADTARLEATAIRECSGELPPTLGDLLTKYVTRHNTKTNTDNLQAAQKHLGDMLTTQPHEIMGKSVFDLVDNMPLKPSTKKKILGFAHRACAWGLARELIKSNPFATFMAYNATVRGPEKPLRASEFKDRYIPTESIKTSLNQFRSLDDRDFFELLLLTGLRRDELRLLRKNEVDMVKGVLTIDPHRRKTRKSFPTALSTRALEILDRRWCTTSHLFPRLAAGHSTAITSRIKTATKGYTPHDLRRTTAKILTELGTSQEVISRIMTHTDQSASGAAITRQYSDYTNDPLMAQQTVAVEALAEFLPK